MTSARENPIRFLKCAQHEEDGLIAAHKQIILAENTSSLAVCPDKMYTTHVPGDV
jgi:hypothetical protein